MSIIYRKDKAFLTLALEHYDSIKQDANYHQNLKRQQVIYWLCSLKYTRKQLRDRMSDAHRFAEAHLQTPIKKPSFKKILDAIEAVTVLNPPEWTRQYDPKGYDHDMALVRQKQQAIKNMTAYFGDEANYAKIPDHSISMQDVN